MNLQLFAEEMADQTTDVGADIGTEGEALATQETEPRVSFEDLIKGDYKEDYERHFKDTLGKRMKSVNNSLAEANEKLSQYNQLVDFLSGRYGTTDISELTNRLIGDDSLFEAEALERGMSVRDLKEMKRMEAENARLRNLEAARAEEAQRQEGWNRIVAQSEEAKRYYPNLDLNAEMQNEEFAKMVAMGFNVKSAYEFAHQSELIAGTMRLAVEQTQQNMARSMQSNAKRPDEAAIGNGAPVVTKVDVSKMSLEELNAIANRAGRGERITF